MATSIWLTTPIYEPQTQALIDPAKRQGDSHRAILGRVSSTDPNLGLCVTSAVLLGFAAPWLVRLLFGEAYIASVMPLRILLVGAIGMGSYLVDVACVNAMGRLRNAGVLTFAGLALVTILDIALIPRYGMNGAVAASSFSYVAMAIFAACQVRLLEGHATPSRRGLQGS